MEIGERIYNGNRAKEVLENECFQWAFEEIKREITEQWQQSPARDSAGREELFKFLKIADKFKLMLTTTLETGKLATAEIERQKSMLERAKDWLSDDY